jgi:hypothetical protein
MHYLTLYYKNLSEQLQERVNYLSKLINEVTSQETVDNTNEYGSIKSEAQRRLDMEREAMGMPDPSEQESDEDFYRHKERKQQRLDQIQQQVQAEREREYPEEAEKRDQYKSDVEFGNKAMNALKSIRSGLQSVKLGPLAKPLGPLQANIFADTLSKEVSLNNNPTNIDAYEAGVQSERPNQFRDNDLAKPIK